MTTKNGLTVDFTTSEREKKKYQAAENAMYSYKYECISGLNKRLRQYKITHIRDSFSKLIAIVYFMSYIPILFLKSLGEVPVEANAFTEIWLKIVDIANTLGFVYTVILIAVILYAWKRKHTRLGYGLFEIIWTIIKCFFKAIGAWIALIFVLYLLATFLPKGSSLYKAIEDKLEVPVETQSSVEYEDLLEDELEWINN